MSTRKLRVGILGATGMVGQRFVSLLEGHPTFDVTVLAASPASAGRPYRDAVDGRWTLATPVPSTAAPRVVRDASDVKGIAADVDFVFCAVDMSKDETARLEESYARAETPVVSNNSAHRDTPDVPMMIPEVNPEHATVIEAQRRRLGTRAGFVAVKPNCSLQSYVPALHPLASFGVARVAVATYQAISGAGKTFESWPEMTDNVIPFIKGEEEKSEREPLKIWGSVVDGRIRDATRPVISAQCIRVPVSDGHLAAVFVSFDRKPSREEIVAAWRGFSGRPQALGLPSAPTPFLTYCEEDARPQTRLDRDMGRGMGVAIGRLRPDSIFDYRFVCLSHNTVRGAAGGAVLTAELLHAEGYIAGK
jgi:aspartate-semialdehyde dehydrogenase